jgi:hypothetical protein
MIIFNSKWKLNIENKRYKKNACWFENWIFENIFIKIYRSPNCGILKIINSTLWFFFKIKLNFPWIKITLRDRQFNALLSGGGGIFISRDIIKPIYKNKRDKMDPKNYRPINYNTLAVSENLLLLVLSEHLIKYSDDYF